MCIVCVRVFQFFFSSCIHSSCLYASFCECVVSTRMRHNHNAHNEQQERRQAGLCQSVYVVWWCRRWWWSVVLVCLVYGGDGGDAHTNVLMCACEVQPRPSWCWFAQNRTSLIPLWRVEKSFEAVVVGTLTANQRQRRGRAVESCSERAIHSKCQKKNEENSGKLIVGKSCRAGYWEHWEHTYMTRVSASNTMDRKL